MAATRAWSETTPAGTDLASTIDDSVKEFKVDVRERLELDHVFNSSAAYDGKHKAVNLRPVDNTTPIKSEATNSTTGAGTTGLVDLTQTWNTTGIVTAIKAVVTDTASNAASLFVNLLVGATSIFSLTKAGILTVLGAVVDGLFEAKHGIVLSGAINVTLSADQNNWAPTGLSTCNVIRINPNGAIRTITGIAAQESYRLLLLMNIDTDLITGKTVIFVSDSASSTVTNRIGGPGFELGPLEIKMIWYDDTLMKWYQIRGENI